jgi:hypothetical protein
MLTKETVGKKSIELAQKAPETRDPIELQRAMQKDYEHNLIECLNISKKNIIGDMYIVVTTKKERLLTNVIRNFFFSRKSCPTPEWDQTVYRYDAKKEHIEFLWTIPSKDTCALFKAHILEIAPEERDLLNYILMFEDGTLLKMAKRLNNEKDYSNLLKD